MDTNIPSAEMVTAVGLGPDRETRRQTLSLRGHAETICALALSRDGGRLVSVDVSGKLRIWDAGRHVLERQVRDIEILLDADPGRLRARRP
jgi:hypothetical protein